MLQDRARPAPAPHRIPCGSEVQPSCSHTCTQTPDPTLGEESAPRAPGQCSGPQDTLSEVRLSHPGDHKLVEYQTHLHWGWY